MGVFVSCSDETSALRTSGRSGHWSAECRDDADPQTLGGWSRRNPFAQDHQELTSSPDTAGTVWTVLHVAAVGHDDLLFQLVVGEAEYEIFDLLAVQCRNPLAKSVR